METLLHFIGNLLFYLLDGLQLLMLIRAVASWFMPEPSNGFFLFVFSLTETIMTPVLLLLDRFEWTHRTPLDVSFIVTVFVLWILQMMVQGVI